MKRSRFTLRSIVNWSASPARARSESFPSEELPKNDRLFRISVERSRVLESNRFR